MMVGALSRAALLGVTLVVGWQARAVFAQDATPSEEPETLSLESGDLTRVRVDQVERVAISQPDVMDLTVVSPNEVLVQAKAAGRSSLMIWDRQGQRTWAVDVVDRGQERAELQLTKLLKETSLPTVEVTKQDGRVYLTGTVTRAEDLEQVEKVLESFPTVKNLVRFEEAQPPLPPPSPLIKLAVQLIDVSRTDLEQLGISWSQSLAFTQPQETDRTLTEALTSRIGSGLTRGSFAATLNALVQRNRARVLAEPKLVTASGKEASSFIGVEVPIIKATSFSTEATSTSASIEFRQVGVLLRMTPRLAGEPAERKVTTVVEAEVSDVDDSVALSIPVGSKTISVPGFKVRKANTEVTTVSGESIVIAGLLKADDSYTSNQVPAFGSLPFLGRLFKAPEIKNVQRELVIIVTPELLEEAASQEALAQAPEQEKTDAVERAMAVAEVSAEQLSASIRDPVLRYALLVQERIGSAVRYPTEDLSSTTARQVKLRLHLFRDGTLGRAIVSESSGVESFDTEALKAAELQAPYPPFPAEISKSDLWLDLPIVFRP